MIWLIGSNKFGERGEISSKLFPSLYNLLVDRSTESFSSIRMILDRYRVYAKLNYKFFLRNPPVTEKLKESVSNSIEILYAMQLFGSEILQYPDEYR